MRAIFVALLFVTGMSAQPGGTGLSGGGSSSSVGGKALCTATITTNCIQPLDAKGSFPLGATVPADAPAGSLAVGGNLYGNGAYLSGVSANSTPQYPANAPTAGMSVAYSGAGLVYTVGFGSYTIAGVQYTTTALQTVTCAAADATNPRLDLIVVNTSGTASCTTGSAGVNPVVPSPDPALYLALSPVLISANGTTPSNVTSVKIYDENTGPAAEWTLTESTSAARITVADTAHPYAGSKDIKFTSVAANDYAMFAPAAPVTPGSYNSLALYIWTTAAWAKTKSLQIYWATTGTQQGTAVTISDGAFGFNSGTTGKYQQIVIPANLFAVPSTANQLVMKVVGGGAAIPLFYADLVMLQAGLAPASSQVQRGISFTFDGGGAALTAGKTIYLRMPYACVINNWSLMSTTAETVTTGVWMVAGGTVIPTVANKINTSGVSLTSGTAVFSSVLTDFTQTAIPKDAWMAATLGAVTASQLVNFVVGCLQ